MTVAAAMMFVGTHMATLAGAVIGIGLSALGWGIAVPVFFALALRVLPPGAVAAGIGWINGIGNLVAAFAPVLIGAIIARTGNFEAGLLVLVVGPLISAACLFSLARLRYGERPPLT
jgi:cyanate permease